jgi:ribonuclease HI
MLWVIGDLSIIRSWILDIEVPRGLSFTDEHDIIVATDGSVVFGVDYHSWVVATDNEQVLLMDSGPYDWDQLIMTSYRSELGGIVSGLVVIGTLVRSIKIKVKSVKLVCDNEAAIKSCNIKRTQSVFHRTEGDCDLISTIHNLQESWYQDTKVNYEWVKGHADDLNRDQTKLERMNIGADELCDVIQETARGPFGARPNCGLWPSNAFFYERSEGYEQLERNIDTAAPGRRSSGIFNEEITMVDTFVQ